MSEQISVEVCYALPERQELSKVKLAPDASVQQALEASGLLAKFPEISLEQGKFGVYGKLVRLDTTLREGDRVEIYRPLIADPKEVRRKRAEEGKAMKKGGGEL
ncbi:RnfH family protein [Uliginosibacterium sp. 31-16]|uniref:RnfH family protein n=1 Tax=Uliginosibacterium sp. 31-16 TaxID=3068315 RepID=UPI00273F03A9|nr:RnfH family protein [Uliginosibacterium sp. 31-16]MDP5239716.1 RnfH family protein [Uliginosibacterium sp. 31-16]